MIKKIVVSTLSFLVLFGVAYTTHSYILDTFKINLRFPLYRVYVFYCIMSLIISTVIMLLSNSKKWSSQLGFIYIFTFVTKFMFFAITFKDSILKIENLSRLESVNLLIPLFIFLLLEVYFIAKVLNKN